MRATFACRETASESRPQPDLTDVRNGSNYTVYLVKPFVKVKKEGQEKRIGVPEIPSVGTRTREPTREQAPTGGGESW